MAKEHPVQGDIVIGVPDSGIAAAIGYSEESKIPYGIGLVKNKYVGRTFISPTQEKRENGVKVKLNVLKESVKGKKVIMVDDSIVRGTTIKQLVKLLKEAGAKEIHMRVSSPPFMWPCYYGTDIPSKKDLIACKYSVEEITKVSDLDSLGYLSLDKLDIITGSKCNYCDACFSGNYPAEIPDYSHKEEENNEVEIHKSAKFTLC